MNRKSPRAARKKSAAPKHNSSKKIVVAKSVVAASLTKLDQLAALMARPDGATIDELMNVSGWQPHSVRGAIAGALKRRGLIISSEKFDGHRRYKSARSVSPTRGAQG